ncbi:MAG: CocE/NonD family hydrolase [Gemmatimonadota bacterium]
MKAYRLVAPWSLLALSFVSARADQGPRVSKFGEYQGYSPSRYDSFLRESVYITVKDGTRIAVDIFRPAVGGVVASERLPVALNVTRYWRSSELEDGSIATMPGLIEAGKKGGPLLDPAEYRSERGSAVMASELLRHGYIIVAMDSRGTGASYGVQTPLLATEADDMTQVIEWSAAQPWSTDKVGMFGASWPGIIQLIAAMAKPAKLAAIFPSVPNFPDFYRIFRSSECSAKARR